MRKLESLGHSHPYLTQYHDAVVLMSMETTTTSRANK